MTHPAHEGVEPRAAGTTWTGGQYSLVRILFGAWLLVGFLRLRPWDPRSADPPVFEEGGGLPGFLGMVPNVFSWSDETWVVQLVLAIGVVASVFFALGAFHRIAAALLAYVWIAISTWFPEWPTPGMPWILVLLLAHLTLPPAPYLSWAARGRADPEGAWRIHLPVFQLAWAMLLLGSIVDVVSKLSSPEWRDGSALRALASAPRFLPAAIVWLGIAIEAALLFCMFNPRARAIAWSAGFAWRLLVLALGGADERLRGLLAVQLFAFDPLWIPAVRATTREHLFFDGSCGLCHRLVRFVAAEDRGSAFFYSPLDGEAIRTLMTDELRATLPDSVAVRTDDGKVLIRSDASLHVLRRIGGAWRALGATIGVIPRPLRELAYRAIARVRKQLFARPEGSCPLLSSRLRVYFLP